MTNRLSLEEIALRKLNALLNPSFPRKYIWALFFSGGFTLSTSVAGKILGSINITLWGAPITITLGNTESYFGMAIGFVLLVLSAFLFYKKFPAEPVGQSADDAQDTDKRPLRISCVFATDIIDGNATALSFHLAQEYTPTSNVITASVTTLRTWDFFFEEGGLKHPVQLPEVPRLLISAQIGSVASLALIYDEHAPLNINLYTEHVIPEFLKSDYMATTIFLLRVDLVNSNGYHCSTNILARLYGATFKTTWAQNLPLGTKSNQLAAAKEILNAIGTGTHVSPQTHTGLKDIIHNLSTDIN